MALMTSFEGSSEDIGETASVEWLVSMTVEDVMFAERELAVTSLEGGR